MCSEEKKKKHKVFCAFSLVVAGGVPEEAVPVVQFAEHPLVWFWHFVVVDRDGSGATVVVVVAVARQTRGLGRRVRYSIPTWQVTTSRCDQHANNMYPVASCLPTQKSLVSSYGLTIVIGAPAHNNKYILPCLLWSLRAWGNII